MTGVRKKGMHAQEAETGDRAPKLGEEEGAPLQVSGGSMTLLTTGSQISSLQTTRGLAILLLSVTLLVNLCHYGHGKLVTSEGLA